MRDVEGFIHEVRIASTTRGQTKVEANFFHGIVAILNHVPL